MKNMDLMKTQIIMMHVKQYSAARWPLLKQIWHCKEKPVATTCLGEKIAENKFEQCDKSVLSSVDPKSYISILVVDQKYLPYIQNMSWNLPCFCNEAP